MGWKYRKDRSKLTFSTELRNDQEAEEPSQEVRQKELGFLILKKSWLWGDLQSSLQDLRRGQEDNAAVINRAQWEDKNHWT